MIGCPTKTKLWLLFRDQSSSTTTCNWIPLKSELLTLYVISTGWMPNFDPFHRPPLVSYHKTELIRTKQHKHFILAWYLPLRSATTLINIGSNLYILAWCKPLALAGVSSQQGRLRTKAKLEINELDNLKSVCKCSTKVPIQVSWSTKQVNNKVSCIWLTTGSQNLGVAFKYTLYVLRASPMALHLYQHFFIRDVHAHAGSKPSGPC